MNQARTLKNEKQTITYVWLILLCSAVIIGGTVIVGCDSDLDEDDAQNDTSPCGMMCNALYDCTNDEENDDDYWAGFQDVSDCVSDCRDVGKDSVINCMLDCDTDLPCEDYRACILEC